MKPQANENFRKVAKALARAAGEGNSSVFAFSGWLFCGWLLCGWLLCGWLLCGLGKPYHLIFAGVTVIVGKR